VGGPVIEAVVLGRVGVDLTPAAPRTSLATATSFVRAVGGFAGNIGTGLARLGISTAVVSSVGDDGHGDHVRSFLAGEGVDVAGLVTHPGARTQVAFFEAWPPETFPVTFYRLAPAPDTLLTLDDVPTARLQRVPLTIVSAALLAAEPSRSTSLRVLEMRAAARAERPGSWTILDLDWRPTLWADPDEAPDLVSRAAGVADVLIGSDGEFVSARLDPHEALDLGPRLVVVKHGPGGVSAITRTGRRTVHGIEVDVVCGLGSGDALTAAFAAGLLRGLDPTAALERGNAAGAIVASRLMCSTSMPSPAEIDDLLTRQPTRSQEAHS
jgi:5-dehydro-2-deoxygluconokinase